MERFVSSGRIYSVVGAILKCSVSVSIHQNVSAVMFTFVQV